MGSGEERSEPGATQPKRRSSVERACSFVQSDARTERALSPVIGTVLIVAITLVMASVVTASLVMFDDDLDDRLAEFNELDAALTDDTPWIGSPSGLVQQSNNRAGATDVRYRINFEIQRKGKGSVPLNNVKLRVVTGSPDMFSQTTEAKLEYVFIDRDGDGQPEQYATSDVAGWEAADDGTSMQINFEGTYRVESDDAVVIVFGGVDNPTAPGVYQLEAKTNGASEWKSGTITII